jgi:hypothetical protein
METYSITDLPRYAECVREGAANQLIENYSDNLDEFISINQVINLIKDKSIGLDESENLLINEDIHNSIHEDIQDWIFNVGLAKLAAAGKIECAWDDDQNDMVFWAASDNGVDQHEDAENNGA